MSFTKHRIDAERKDIDRFATTIVTGSETLHGITKERSWMGGRRVTVHVYYNEVKATATRNRLYGRVQQLLEAAENDPEDGKLQDQFKRYLIIRKSSNDPRGYTITVREDVIADEIAYAGWLVLVGNHIENAAEAIRVYRDKDVVEKGFLRLSGRWKSSTNRPKRSVRR
jgi:transposase